MSAFDYVELQGAPGECMNTPPWTNIPLVVSVGYGGVTANPVSLQGLLAPSTLSEAENQLFGSEGAYTRTTPGTSLGYDSDGERDVWSELKNTASATANNTAFYHPDAKVAIVALAQQAEALLLANDGIYKTFEEDVKLPAKLFDGSIQQRAFPLSVKDSEVASQIDTTDIGLSLEQREMARDTIRANYHRAVHVLWCAMYGAAQSESWRGNRSDYYAQQDAEEPGIGDVGLAPPGGPGTGSTPGGELSLGQTPLPPVDDSFPPWEAPTTPPDVGEFDPEPGSGTEEGYPGGTGVGESASGTKKKKSGGGLGLALVAIFGFLALKK